MRIEIHLLARLLRIPLLRVEGVVDITDLPGSDDGGGTRRVVEVSPGVPRAPGHPRVRRPAPILGRDLAAAEAIVSGLDGHVGRAARARPTGRR
ncbi:hypothetical protein GJV82_02260 [Cellulosimicrobium sp. BIT-GX5]|uniref:Uncharacterized protein n=1 Tax=Cellulosimicrobium composti TaxID=2672572 RepID=A0A6N7ZEQ0_9MICO|nr:hypothetical protein [Cellulosimicrobium composti]MTG87782.1 hypothetical protein [Cellulosimicrobium composti]